ncbi:hypothetical protein [Fundidesulfovibrio magnetotacticus]|nr:hypothetical protein [Fundidesulfovibrio magnetotacticus]
MPDHDITLRLLELEVALDGQRWQEAARAMDTIFARVPLEDIDAFAASGMVAYGRWIEVLVRTRLHVTSPRANRLLQGLLRKVWDCTCVAQRGHLLSFWMAVAGLTFRQAVDEHTLGGCIDSLCRCTKLPRGEVEDALLAHAEFAHRQAVHAGSAVQ